MYVNDAEISLASNMMMIEVSKTVVKVEPLDPEIEV
jgi:hypothetical protein